MKWEFLEIDGQAAHEKWGTGDLTSRILEASSLDEGMTYDLLRGDDHLTTSKAMCVLKACERIMQAKKKGEKIFVGGDYDADGICSTAIMKKTLDVLGIENGYYIPNRFKEGYGLSARTVEMAHAKGYDVIMTVDNGVKAHEALQKAKELGMYVIVTDHHMIEEEIEADLVVHPDYMEEEYRFLSGAGVALQLSRNLIGEGTQYNDLVAICAVALIGDVMPLWRETRRLVKRGLSILKQGRPRSLSCLMYPGATVDETAVAFNIVPKLNSVGRMNDISNVNTLVPYLLSTDERTISAYSSQLNLVNEKRKELSESETKKAEEMMGEDNLPVIFDPSFHEGICGLVAGRIANSIHKPVLVMAEGEDLIKGSGRSVPGFNMFEFFADFEETAAFGGHEQAVGISVRKEDFESFQKHVREKMEASSYTYEETAEKAIVINAADVNFDAVSDLSVLSPYPKDLIRPYFAVRNPKIVNVKKTAKTVKYTVEAGNSTFDATVYARKGLPYNESPEVIIGTLGINRFRGKISLQMIVEDIV